MVSVSLFTMNNSPVSLKVKVESLPVRCEVCHQADCFDAQSNHCSRCIEVSRLELLHHRIQATQGIFVGPVLRGFAWQNITTRHYARVINISLAILIIIIASFYLLPEVWDMMPTNLELEPPIDYGEGGEDFTLWGMCGVSWYDRLFYTGTILVFSLIFASVYLGLLVGYLNYRATSTDHQNRYLS
ncbi:MAG: hypothetical protein AB1489_12575 [Acidobacteriota bacterium]